MNNLPTHGYVVKISHAWLERLALTPLTAHSPLDVMNTDWEILTSLKNIKLKYLLKYCEENIIVLFKI